MLPSGQKRIAEQDRFSYSPLETQKPFETQTKTIVNQGKNK